MHANGGRSPAPSDYATLLARLASSLPHGRSESHQALADAARIRHVAEEETIFQQGEPVPLVMVIEGHVAFRRTTLDGQRLTVGVSSAGGLVGISAISEIISPVEMFALTNGLVAIWQGEDLRRAAGADGDLALDLIDKLTLFLAMLTEKLDGYLHQDARRRVIRILARHRDLFFTDPAILSRSHLPGLVGTSREMTGRVLRELEREGLVARVGRNGLRLLDALQFEAASEDETETRMLGPKGESVYR
jgi:CRP/FNR family transcriptional regulator, anaerobic regulatory protein